MDYVAMVLLITGVHLIGKKQILGLYFNLIGSFIFLIWAFAFWNNIPIGLTNVFMVIVNIIAIKNWRKDEQGRRK